MNETALDFARRVRKSFFSLPSDLITGLQTRDILCHHIRQSLPKTWSNIRGEIPTLANAELADHVVQSTECFENWALDDQIFQRAILQSDLITNNQTSVSEITDPRIQNVNVFAAENDSNDDAAYTSVAKNSKCYNCEKMGHWANLCPTKNSSN